MEISTGTSSVQAYQPLKKAAKSDFTVEDTTSLKDESLKKAQKEQSSYLIPYEGDEAGAKFPPDSAPEEVKKAWAETTKGLSFSEQQSAIGIILGVTHFIETENVRVDFSSSSITDTDYYVGLANYVKRNLEGDPDLNAFSINNLNKFLEKLGHNDDSILSETTTSEALLLRPEDKTTFVDA